VTEEWRKVRSDEFHNLFSSVSAFRMMSQGRWDGLDVELTN